MSGKVILGVAVIVLVVASGFVRLPADQMDAALPVWLVIAGLGLGAGVGILLVAYLAKPEQGDGR